MTQQEIIKAIKACYKNGYRCRECPLFYEDGCNDKLGREVITLLKEQEKRINELEEKLRIDIPSKERNDNFDLYDTPMSVTGMSEEQIDLLKKALALYKFVVDQRNEYGESNKLFCMVEELSKIVGADLRS